MEAEIQAWLNALGVFAGPLVAGVGIFVSLRNRRLNVAQVAESHEVIRSVGDLVNTVEAKVEQVVGKVADVGSQVDTVTDTVNGRFAEAQAITKQTLEHVKTIDPTVLEKAADAAAEKIVETAKATAEELAKATAETLAEATRGRT